MGPILPFFYRDVPIISVEYAQQISLLFGKICTWKALDAWSVNLASFAYKVVNISSLFRIECMEARQDEIKKPQRKALIDKAHEFGEIKLETVQNLKSFSADLKQEAWENITTANVWSNVISFVDKSIAIFIKHACI